MIRNKNTFSTVVGALVLTALVVTPPASADFVIVDDLIVDGSACIGFDCVNGEVFGFDTIRLKENNLRIKFDDTSIAAAFPRNDWQLTANDSANGGASKFSIEDISGSRTPFTILAGARTNALFVDAQGDVGIGTSTPVGDLHIKVGDTPTLRLEQDSSSGFTPQTWDVAGNEVGFFVRDATSGSTLPLRIRVGAPSSAIDVAANGTVGIGTSSPGVLGATDLSLTLGESFNGGPARLGFQTDGEDWAIVANNANGDLLLASSSAPNGVLSLDESGLTPGGGAGTALCVGTGNVLCQCGSCP